jgi:trimeric autotransporter adhesin
MSRSPLRSWVGLFGVALLASCGIGQSPGGPEEETATIVLAITTVPSDVQCLEVTVAGAQTTTQLFAVVPGQSTSIVLQGLASGTVSISERAFAVPCSQVTAATTPTWVSVMPATAVLAPGQIADVTVVLRRAAQVRITTDFQDGQFITSVGALAFGNVNLGATRSLPFTITNGGTTTATLPALTITGPDAGFFFVQAPGGAGNPCSATTSLAPGTICTTAVVFAPTSPGARSATFNIGNIPAIALSGTGVAIMPAFTASPASLSFGSVPIGNNLSASITITNTGNGAGVVPALSIAGTDATQFSVQPHPSAGNPCSATTNLAPGASCLTLARFAPTSAGVKTAAFTVGGAPAVALSGTGVANLAVFTATPASISFGNVSVGGTATANVTLTNTGNATGVLPALSIAGTDVSEFSVQANPNAGAPCTATTSLAPGATCQTVARFSPTSAGFKSATIVIGGSPAGGVALIGTGVATSFTTSVSALVFGNVNIGGNASMNFTITNSGPIVAPLPALSLTGADAAQFLIQAPGGAGNPCSATTSLAPGALCTTGVTFSPTSAGAKTATFNIGANPAVALSGTGVATSFIASQTSLAFGNVSVGATVSMNFTIANAGPLTATLPPLNLSGADSSQFFIQAPGTAGNPCSATTSLAPGALCTTGVSFRPTSSGAKAASFNIGSTAAVALTGTGI